MGPFPLPPPLAAQPTWQQHTKMPPPDFPPAWACIFDMDGLLINTEDIYKQCADNVLTRYGRPPLPWPINVSRERCEPDVPGELPARSRVPTVF